MIAILLTVDIVIAQGAWTTYTIDNGLTNNVIKVMTMDPDGNLWCGTAGGLSYFDGISWKELQIEYEHSKPYIKSIAFSPEGILWIFLGEREGFYLGEIWYDTGGWINTGFLRFDGSEWITYTENDGLPSSTVNAISIDINGTVWAGFGYGGVSWFDGETWTTYDPGDGGHVYSIAISKNGEVWVGTWGGLLKYNGSTWEKYTQADGLPYNFVSDIAIDYNGKVWFSTYSYGGGPAGLSCFDGITVTTYTTADGLIHNKVLSIAIDNENNVWIGTSGGVSRFDGQTWTNFTTNDGLVSDYVSSILVDNDGIIWIGTHQGLSRFEPIPTFVEISGIVPFKGCIKGNFPNPFNPSTTIEYRIPQSSQLILSIYNISGQLVTVLKDEYQQAGNYSITWNAEGLPSGLYFCTLKANGFTETRKMLLVR